MEKLNIINGSYEQTQVYLLYQLLNELNTGNNHNQSIVDVLNQINNKNNNDIIQAIQSIPQADLLPIIAAINNINTTLNNNNNNTPDYSSIINSIKQIPQYNDSQLISAINGINIPQVDLSDVIEAINGLKSNLNNGDVNINVEEKIYCESKPILEVTYEPIKNRTINVHKTVTKVVVPPKVIKIKQKEAYARVCGTPNPSDYVQCVQCVDKWLESNPNPELKQVTRSGTGCGIKKR